jgi:hypothetical protein
MAIVISVVLVAAGTILFWRADGAVGGIDLDTAGVILMASGAIGFAASLLLSARRTSVRGAKDGPERDLLIPAAAEEWPDSEARQGHPRPPEQPPIP